MSRIRQHCVGVSPRRVRYVFLFGRQQLRLCEEGGGGGRRREESTCTILDDSGGRARSPALALRHIGVVSVPSKPIRCVGLVSSISLRGKASLLDFISFFSRHTNDPKKRTERGSLVSSPGLSKVHPSALRGMATAVCSSCSCVWWLRLNFIVVVHFLFEFCNNKLTVCVCVFVLPVQFKYIISRIHLFQAPKQDCFYYVIPKIDKKLKIP